MTLWNELDRDVILASGSPRRKDILEGLGVTFRVQPPPAGLEEKPLCIESLDSAIQQLALAKAREVARQYKQSLTLGGDTVVTIGDEVLGKPADAAEAERMIRTLSGQTHVVYSGVALACEAEQFAQTRISATSVVFRSLSEEEIAAYLDHNDYVDKAGAYAIQGRAMAFVDSIHGCYYNVVGLPVTKTIELFQAYISRKECNDVRKQ